MGVFQPKKFRKLNRLTGKFEWVYPPPTEYLNNEARGGKLKINVRNIKP